MVKNFIKIQNDVIEKYHIDLCDGNKCESQPTHHL